MKDTELKDRCILSAVEYLKRHEYKILDREWSCNGKVADIVAQDADCLVFVKVEHVKTVDDYAKLETSEYTKKLRREFETVALAYVTTHTDIDDMPMRCDVIGVCRADKNRCMIRQQVNALGVA